ncbi:bifunctional 4-hydroxy-2-oxoglutarate aldolase/2-dehydro-3-deoxy-phosphogluconate aldolase [Candidatus Vallotia cooleyia]|uniref:bifunctional 4-hydroxy-2-oxoglutarate aldolase/2-dehydro-3-deoxy-phosphogluconate aldolase n=1 Tax=Candidatus Vallotiella adelgis TaxID=1177211 RepID=UPI001D014978|nr:bifunctional 4-hydroxy-2-oxoglutarate aldolase/2-dehydro-3-deoxy-phosphogluconate aldolase [Candidatus Vallotia cooleyia]UDG82176.1 2-dehydro-3-deoxy-phosphogluconate aldolase [Candidatus Vallotia cooleyia]
MKSVNEIVSIGPVIPVLTFESVEQGMHVAHALYEGGIKVLEITLRTAAGLRAIEQTLQLASDIVVGAGTLTTSTQVEKAKRAGAKFGVSPGLTSEIHEASQDVGLPLLPGVMTPSDILFAISLGYEIVKFFPAQQAGGLDMLQAFRGPFPALRFCPTGGITRELATSFLALPNVVCVGGSWLTPKTAIAEQNWTEMTCLARAASQIARPNTNTL